MNASMLCPVCGSDQVTCEGAQVTAEDEFRLIAELGSCLTCGATLRYADGQLTEISLKDALDDALNRLQFAAAQIAARLSR